MTARERQDIILIVDEDTTTRTALSGALRALGFTTVCAGDEPSALSLARTVNPGLVLLDPGLGGLLGFELCRRLKAVPEQANLPVIFTAALTRPENVVAGLSAGGVDYVAKPVNIEELAARIDVHLAIARAARRAWAALDMFGRAMLAANSDGEVLWRTSRASELLVDDDGVELAPTRAVLRYLIQSGPLLGDQPRTIEAGGRQFDVAYLGNSPDQEHYFVLAEKDAAQEIRVLRAQLKLTNREGEVLLWIARGKSTRDIGEILNISPRTVNKHLEQIYPKLGVENRTAAAARATRVASAWRH
jgi:DNA-binding NarL/FixJ family response regulator